MSFSSEQIAALSAPLAAKNVKERTQAGRTVSYIEGWVAIAEANRIFGFDGWMRETVEVRCVAEKERKIGQSQRDGWGVSYVCKVRVTVSGLVREGIGSGHGIDVDLGLAHESAIKEAETDAMKRALMTFGNPFGLALYDKTQANVSHDPPPRHVQTIHDAPLGPSFAINEPTMTERLVEAQRKLEDAARLSLADLKMAFVGLDHDLRPALEARKNALKADLEGHLKGKATFESGRQA